MSRVLKVISAGPGVTVQDAGFPGYMAYGISRGGAADVLALAEGEALLRQSSDLAAIEMAGMGGVFEASEDITIALTGAPMRAQIDGQPIVWNASHALAAGARLSIGAVTQGVYGYLHVAGGFETPQRLGSRSTHLAAGIGTPLAAGDELPIGKGDVEPGWKLDPEPRFSGGTIRILPSLQTHLFSDADIARFEAIAFTRDNRGNRMGVRLMPEGDGFATTQGLNLLSEVVITGDIQITGDGTPFILLAECQTVGGYPRIGSVLPTDLPKVVQAPPGANLTFRFITQEEGLDIERTERARRNGFRKALQPLIRDPARMADLLSYQLVGGVTAGDDLER